MKTVQKSKAIYTFSPKHKPVVKVKTGEKVLLKTEDALGGQIRSEKDSIKNLEFVVTLQQRLLKKESS